MLKNKNKRRRNHFACAHRKSLHHLPDALCQQLRALIDLRLPNCALIKERPCSVPSFLWLYLFGFGVDTAGPNVKVWHARVSLFSFRRVLFIPRRDLRSDCAAGTQRPQRVAQRSDMLTDRRREVGRGGEINRGSHNERHLICLQEGGPKTCFSLDL